MTAPNGPDTICNMAMSALVEGELTIAGIYERMVADGFRGAYTSVKRKMDVLTREGSVQVVRQTGPFRERVFVLSADQMDRIAPCERIVLPPVCVMPTRPLNPMQWFLVTSGCELAA